MKKDEFYLLRALELAKMAAESGEVPVGAVVVNTTTGEIVGEAHNAPIANHDPTGHAEILALRSAAIKNCNYRLLEHDIYVSLEPCAMCAGAIAIARIRRVVFSAPDKKGGAVINGVRYFEQPTCHWHPEVVQGCFAEENADLLKSFFRARRKTNSLPQITGDDSQFE